MGVCTHFCKGVKPKYPLTWRKGLTYKEKKRPPYGAKSPTYEKPPPPYFSGWRRAPVVLDDNDNENDNEIFFI